MFASVCVCMFLWQDFSYRCFASHQYHICPTFMGSHMIDLNISYTFICSEYFIGLPINYADFNLKL